MYVVSHHFDVTRHASTHRWWLDGCRPKDRNRNRPGVRDPTFQRTRRCAGVEGGVGAGGDVIVGASGSSKLCGVGLTPCSRRTSAANSSARSASCSVDSEVARRWNLMGPAREREVQGTGVQASEGRGSVSLRGDDTSAGVELTIACASQTGSLVMH